MIRFEQPTGHGTYWYDAGEVSRHVNLKHEGKNIGRNKFLEMLRFNGAIMKDSNMPSQLWINMGLARYHFTNKQYKQYGMPLFSDKGIAYIENKLSSGVFQVQFLKKKNKYFKNIDEIL